jgi:hypothetical protein
MSKERLYIYDVTLRDGAQTQGVDFSVDDKRQIAEALDALGVDYVEGGWPGANPGDTEFFSTRPPLKKARFTAFGMTKRAGRSVSNDPGFAAVVNSSAEAVTLVGKSWDFQVDVALGIPRQENIEAITESIAAVKASGREALFDAEHFFDGYKANPDYALDCNRLVRYQRRFDVARGLRDRRRCGSGNSRHPAWHPRPQRHRTSGGQQPGSGARRSAPGAGHAQRSRRALWQRQFVLDHPEPDAEGAIRL